MFDNSKKKMINDLADLCYDGDKYYVNKDYVKNTFGIKSDTKLKELLKVSGIKNPDNAIKENKVYPNDLSLIAEFVGGKKAEKLYTMVERMNKYILSTSKTQKEFNKEKDDQNHSYFEIFNNSDYYKYCISDEYKEKLNTSERFSFAIPTVGMLNYSSKYSTVNWYINNMRYYYVSAQNVISNNANLSLARQISEELSDTFYNEFTATIFDNLTEEEKDKVKNVSYDLVVHDTLLLVKNVIIKQVCQNEGISEKEIDVRFTKEILNNAMLLSTNNVTMFKSLYKAFCIIQYNYIIGKYSYRSK